MRTISALHTSLFYFCVVLAHMKKEYLWTAIVNNLKKFSSVQLLREHHWSEELRSSHSVHFTVSSLTTALHVLVVGRFLRFLRFVCERKTGERSLGRAWVWCMISKSSKMMELIFLWLIMLNRRWLSAYEKICMYRLDCFLILCLILFSFDRLSSCLALALSVLGNDGS